MRLPDRSVGRANQPTITDNLTLRLWPWAKSGSALERSACGTKRTWCDVRSESAFRGRAEVAGTRWPPLLGYLLARSAELRREILKLRETVFHGEDSLGIVHVNARGVFERRQRGREYVHQSQRRMIGH